MPRDLPAALDPVPPPPSLATIEAAETDASGDAHARVRHDQIARIRTVARQIAISRGLAATDADRWLADTRRYLRHLLDYAPYVEGVYPCKVVSLQDRTLRHCTVELVDDGRVIPQVQYDPVVPSVGAEYAVRQTKRLNPQHERGLPEHVHWTLKVASGKWLYYPTADAAFVERLPWPPAEEAIPERLHSLDGRTLLGVDGLGRIVLYDAGAGTCTYYGPPEHEEPTWQQAAVVTFPAEWRARWVDATPERAGLLLTHVHQALVSLTSNRGGRLQAVNPCRGPSLMEGQGPGEYNRVEIDRIYEGNTVDGGVDASVTWERRGPTGGDATLGTLTIHDGQVATFRWDVAISAPEPYRGTCYGGPVTPMFSAAETHPSPPNLQQYGQVDVADDSHYLESGVQVLWSVPGASASPAARAGYSFLADTAPDPPFGAPRLRPGAVFGPGQTPYFLVAGWLTFEPPPGPRMRARRFDLVNEHGQAHPGGYTDPTGGRLPVLRAAGPDESGPQPAVRLIADWPEGDADTRLRRSANDGELWSSVDGTHQELGGAMGAGLRAQDRSLDNLLVEASGGPLWYSEDWGTTWTRIRDVPTAATYRVTGFISPL